MVTRIAVSILTLDYTEPTVINQALLRITNADYIHYDVMDGKFVKNKTFNHELVAASETGLLKDVHLMVKEPEKVVDKYIAAGANEISFHVEACKDPKKLISKLKRKGIRVGIALNPETPLKKIESYLPLIDKVLVMSVKPGKGGQKFLRSALKKIEAIHKKQPLLDVAVDGGINDKTAQACVGAGANILVAGSYIWANDPKIAIDVLRNS